MGSSFATRGGGLRGFSAVVLWLNLAQRWFGVYNRFWFKLERSVLMSG